MDKSELWDAEAQRRKAQACGVGQAAAHARGGPGDAVPDQGSDAEMQRHPPPIDTL